MHKQPHEAAAHAGPLLTRDADRPSSFFVWQTT